MISSWERKSQELGIFEFNETNILSVHKYVAFTEYEKYGTRIKYSYINSVYSKTLDTLTENAKRYYPGDYVNGSILTYSLKSAQMIRSHPESTNADYKTAAQTLGKTLEALVPVTPFPALPPPSQVSVSRSTDSEPPAGMGEQSYKPDVPNVFLMRDGTLIDNAEAWPARDREIREILQYYTYGIFRDGAAEGERITAAPVINNARPAEALPKTADNAAHHIDITVTRPQRVPTTTYSPGKAVFSARVLLPDGEPPSDGWPVIIGIGRVGKADYILSRGYAICWFETQDVASDDTERRGAFYDLYPYLNDWTQQTGVLMAWAWGAAKIVDALETAEVWEAFRISPKETMVIGVSRNGKAAALAAAFERRIKVGIPTCSGFSGMTTLRYKSAGKTYRMDPWFSADYPKIGGTDDEGNPYESNFQQFPEWTSYGGTEPMSSHANNGWMTEMYKEFSGYEQLPYDQHFLAALCATGGRYLMMISGVASDPWSSPPGMWYTYENTRPVFKLLGITDHLAVNIHPDLHGNEQEDFIKLFAWYERRTDTEPLPRYIQGTLERTGLTLLESLQTCVFDTAENRAADRAL
jgi:hypothetical protein